jgi:branched-chain amino acid transport system substrate-binding protein
VTVYASAPLCAGAKRELARDDGHAGNVRVQVICLDDAEAGGRLDLATIGANARRATEDSTTIAYIGEPTPAATRFSAPILEAASVPQLSGPSGAAAMSRLLRAVRNASDSGSLRESVQEALAGS